MPAPASTSDVFIVDDDGPMRDALSVAFTLAGYRVSLFCDGEMFLETTATRMPAAVLLDLHLPGKSGLGVLKELDAARYAAPIIIISGDGDVACAVEAVKNGAFDYVVKPFDARALVTRVGNAIVTFSRRAGDAAPNDAGNDFPGQAALTPREREVLSEIAGGASNKEAGRRLGISPRTVEVHRARIMEKIGARNAADLVRIVLGGGNGRNGHARNVPPELVA